MGAKLPHPLREQHGEVLVQQRLDDVVWRRRDQPNERAKTKRAARLLRVAHRDEHLQHAQPNRTVPLPQRVAIHDHVFLIHYVGETN